MLIYFNWGTSMTNKESLLKQFIIFIIIATIIEMVLLAFFHVGYLFVGAINIFVTLVYLICAIKNKNKSKKGYSHGRADFDQQDRQPRISLPLRCRKIADHYQR